MSESCKFQLSNLPEDGLRLFHGLANWVEQAKIVKPKLIKWSKGQKQLNMLHCIKPKQNGKLVIPAILPSNTLYLPASISGMGAIKQLRHAFCHGRLVYNEVTKDYKIESTDLVSITGRFTLEAIDE